MRIRFEQTARQIAAFCLLLFFPIWCNGLDDPQKTLGWVSEPAKFCGGYYQDSFLPIERFSDDALHMKGDEAIFSRYGTTTLNNIVIKRNDESLRADKGLIFRSANDTHKIETIDLTGHVELHEPNTVIFADNARYDVKAHSKNMQEVMYRILMDHFRPVGKHFVLTQKEVNAPYGVLTAWGYASAFSQTKPRQYDLTNGTYTTCPPDHPVWMLKAKTMHLDKETGRGSASNVTLNVAKNIPVFYLPYINFPIDARRKTGFLWPSIGTQNHSPYVSLPFYWNIAPNYDMLLTPTFFENRGLMFADQFRYLNERGRGDFNLTILPNDNFFADFKTDNEIPKSTDSTTIQAAKIRLSNASTTRSALVWHDDTRFNENWTTHVNFSHVSDDYFLRDFGSTVDDVSQNQLLQEGEINYQSDHWHFTGRLQAYQTLHPFNETVTLNQYRRFPQLLLNFSYPQQLYGMDFFAGSELTNFDIRKTPGSDVSLPVGLREHLQPGLSFPFLNEYLFVTPRLQFALSRYTLRQTTETETPGLIKRGLPIFDILFGSSLERKFTFSGYQFKQTLEPQIMYTYIPYRNQSEIPLFDTTINTPTYDQLFNYNRFSGIDRINDANQLSVGVSTRLFDDETGLEKVKFGIGDIIYFRNREVTLCESSEICNDYPNASANTQRFSPITSTIDFHIYPAWSVSGNATFDPNFNRMGNSSIAFHYQPAQEKVINFGFNYVPRASLANIKAVPESDNKTIIQIPNESLKVTDASFAWPITSQITGLGRISHDWASNHLQNILYGIQYDTCCVTVRLVGNRVFLGIDPDRHNQPQYNNEFYIQLSLKGLGNVGTGNPQSLLNNVTGYTSAQFG